MLHTVNKSPFEKTSLQTCLRLAKPGHDIILIEDGVYAAAAGTALSGTVKDAARDYNMYVLGPDLASRGMSKAELIEGIEVVDYAGFVQLAVNNEQVQSWL